MLSLIASKVNGTGNVFISDPSCLYFLVRSAKSIFINDLLIIIIPILIISIYLKIDSSGPIFFLSKRVGKRKKIFLMPKFRTMINGTKEVETAQFKEINRITNFGKILRKYSIDEIPQLLKVIKGEMSLVGPRPLYPEDNSHFDEISTQNNRQYHFYFLRYRF